MKKILFFLVLSLFAFNSNLKAEIVNLQKEEKKFGDWKVFCEIDAMMDAKHCKMGAKFFDNASSITLEPNPKSFSQLFIVIPQIKTGSFLKIRTAKNDLILPQVVDKRDFGMIKLDDRQKKILFDQMKNEDFLFFRFNINDSDKEITAKINLNDFRNALQYYYQRISE